MNNATQYAKALHELGGKSEHIAPLRQILARRGHAKLMPHILAEYEKIAVQNERLMRHKSESPEQKRTRALVELYKKLVA